MPEEAPGAPPAPIPFHIGEEFSGASKKLPPAKIVAICVAVVGVIVGLIAYLQRPHSFATGSIDTITTADVPGQNSILVALNISIQNGGETPYVIRSMKAGLETKDGGFSDEPASAVDFERYYQAFPLLKKAPLDPLKPEDRIAAGASTRGTIIVIFPVSSDAFASRKSLKVTIQPYDQPVPLVLAK